jgi:hypothetical protein
MDVTGFVMSYSLRTVVRTLMVAFSAFTVGVVTKTPA